VTALQMAPAQPPPVATHLSAIAQHQPVQTPSQLTSVDDGNLPGVPMPPVVESNQTAPNRPVSEPTSPTWAARSGSTRLGMSIPANELAESAFPLLLVEMFAGGRRAVLHRPDGSAANPRRRNPVRTSVDRRDGVRVMTS